MRRKKRATAGQSAAAARDHRGSYQQSDAGLIGRGDDMRQDLEGLLSVITAVPRQPCHTREPTERCRLPETAVYDVETSNVGLCRRPD